MSTLTATIPSLPDASALDGTELIELSQSDVSVKALLSALATYIFANITTFAVNGGAAGNFTVTGITTASTLISVMSFANTGAPFTNASVLTSEFTITGANTINNTGGTDTTSHVLMVIFGG